MFAGVGEDSASLCSSNLLLRAAKSSGVRKLFILRLLLFALNVILGKCSS